MPLNVRILFPILVLATLSAFSVFWLSYTSIRSAETRAESAATSLEFVARSAEMATSLRAAEAELKPILDMTRLVDVSEVWIRITAHTDLIAQDIDWLVANTPDAKLQLLLQKAEQDLAIWSTDASILLGQTPSSEIPTTEKVNRTEKSLETTFDSLSLAAQAKMAVNSTTSMQEMRSTLVKTAILLSGALFIVLCGSFVVARDLSRDVSNIAARLLAMSAKGDSECQNRNVLTVALQATDTLEAALNEKIRLEELARKAELERQEVAEKERLRAEDDRERVVAERQAAEARAERQKRRAEQSAELEQEISSVADAAQDGNLEVRINRTFDEPSLNDVSHSINALLETVAGSILLTQQTLRSLARGDLTARFEGNHLGVFNSLQTDINQTAAQFQEAMQHIKTSSQTIFEDSSAISTAAQSLAVRTERAALHSEATSTAVGRVSQAASQMADTAAQSRKLVENSIEDVRSSEGSMQDAMRSIDDIANHSKQISAVVGVINDIAFQTNLLALNAGVEAARAGKAGAGFAVVASEVRALAQRSSESAKEIEDLIKSSGERVERGVVVVNQTGEALKTVAGSVTEISARIFKIAEDANSQSDEIHKIKEALSEIDRATQSNAAMFEETTAASQSLTVSAEALSELAGRFESGAPQQEFRASA